MNNSGKKNEVKYVISVTFSEPQIIDMRKVFFVECKETRHVRRKSCAPALRKTFSKQMENVDSIITNKIQTGEEFEDIWKDIAGDKDPQSENIQNNGNNGNNEVKKIHRRLRKNKSFCLDDVLKP
jgi:hypothetical protein